MFGTRIMTIAALTLVAGAGMAGALAVACADDNCEPARWSGRAALSADADAAAREGGARMAQGPMMGPGRGMMRRRGMGMMRGGMMGRGNPVRHRFAMMNGVPASYAEMRNPLKADAETLKAGAALYSDNCASCHGASARGDGEAGKELNPRPADIAFVIDRPIATDGFLMWTISEGGEALKTDMPAFKDVLSEKERWQIITWLRYGLKR